jgi:tetratricopeptide repeat protein
MKCARDTGRSLLSCVTVSRCEAPKSDRTKRAAVLNWRRVAFCASIMICLSVPSSAQKGGGTGGARIPNSGPVPRSGGPPVYGDPYPPPLTQPVPDIPPPSKPVVIEDENCLPWNVSSAQDTAVSVTRLQVPSKARSEYKKACEANSKNKFDEAEKRARDAIGVFDGYSAAWVMLGVTLEEQKKRDEARNACVHAATIDPKYLPAYLCQAELSTRSQEWDKVLNLADLSLGLNYAGDGYAYYYRATALYHTKHLAEAKKDATHAQEIDVKRNEVPLYFLLAQIYEAEGNKAEAATQLRQMLKGHLDPQQENAAKQYLAALEAQPEGK